MLSDNELHQIYSLEEIETWFSKGLTLNELRELTEQQEVSMEEIYKESDNNILVESPEGWSPVTNKYHYQRPVYRISFSDGSEIKCSDSHMLQTTNLSWLCPFNLYKGVRIKDNNGGYKTVSQVDYLGNDDVYDITVDNDEHSYFANNVVNHNSGTGKSLFLQNVTINWAKENLNCVYITLELSENLVALRFDSMVTETPTKQIFKNIDDVDLKVKMTGKKWGNIMIKYMPAGSSTNDIRAYLKEFEIQRGIKPDAVIVDYLDLIHPNNARVNPGDLFIKDKFVSEELRSLAQEMNLLLCTASQLNREAIQEQEHDHSHIAGGLSKINTADNVMTIFTSQPMRERGEYRLQFIKTRSSAGVGTKLDLAFDSSTMRITDLETGSSSDGGKKDQSSLAAEIKAKAKSRNPQSAGATPNPSNGSDEDSGESAPTGNPKSQVQGEKLRDLLSKIQDR